MNESTYTRSVNKHLPASVYSWKVSDRFTAGIPDAWYSGLQCDLWIEFKYLHKMLRSKVKPKLSALQSKWLGERYTQGRNVAVVVGSPQGAIIYEYGEWDNGKEPEDLITKKQLAAWITNKVNGQ